MEYSSSRYERRATPKVVDRTRSPSARDRDRVLYSKGFSRLSGISQVAGAHESPEFHNRLLHSLKVGQIARRAAERLTAILAGSDELPWRPDVDAIEAAAIAHDIGHPPFGHAGEAALDSILRERGLVEGFESNAQAFRYLTRLAAHDDSPGLDVGLNLTRGTLRAGIKYPWTRMDHHPGAPNARKFGAYQSDADVLNWALSEDAVSSLGAIESSIVEWADDVTYAVHDFEDFYRARVLPAPRDTLDSYIERAAHAPPAADEQARGSATQWLMRVLPNASFDGSSGSQTQCLAMRRELMSHFVEALAVREVSRDVLELDIDPAARYAVGILKSIVFDQIIESEGVVFQQIAYRRMMETVYDALVEQRQSRRASRDSELQTFRTSADHLSCLDETQTTQLYRTLTGAAPTVSSRVALYEPW